MTNKRKATRPIDLTGRSSVLSGNHIVDVNYTLQCVFKKDSFRGSQREIIEAVLKGYDVLVFLPTGNGKSLTFQLPAVAVDHGVTIVISPLLALIENQVNYLRSLNVNTEFIHHEMSYQDRERVLNDLKCGHPHTRLLYMSAEMISTKNFGHILKELDRIGELERFVIDEAHCCIEWGHDFRKSYGRLGFLRKQYSHIPITALTATASESVKEKILEILHLKSNRLRIFTTCMNRPNLHYEVRYVIPDSSFTTLYSPHSVILNDVLSFLQQYKQRRILNTSSCTGSGIIYCGMIETVENVTSELQKAGFGAHSFHSKKDYIKKKLILENWTNNVPGFEIVIATIAFGMGVDKPNVRFVINFDIPNTLESYYQLSGRAGRDGKGARCILYYCINFHHPNTEESIKQYCLPNQCRHVALVKYFEPKLDTSTSDIQVLESKYCNYACDVCKNYHFVSQRYFAMKNASDDLLDGLEFQMIQGQMGID